MIVTREFLVELRVYRTTTMSARGQWELLELARPVLHMVSESASDRGRDEDRVRSMASAVAALASGSDDQLSQLTELVLGACERGSPSESGEILWSEVAVDSLSLSETVGLIGNVISVNLTRLFKMRRANFFSNRPTPEYVPVYMPDKDDWLYRPVVRRMCLYESLIDGRLDLSDVAKMNDLLDVLDENEYRASQKPPGPKR